ncbi:protein FAM185A [Esox lucius]|uniref:DUF4097 domain-containing protein n=1 Tax=Esox lucius TaxID=8010 RepID=A0A3P9ANX9_ESOLU|nr:protein FAM185A [Esox lucius]
MFCFSANQRVCVGLLRWKSLVACLNNNSSVLILKAFSTSRALTTKTVNTPLKQWVFDISPFSKVRVQLQCDISIQPLDPHPFPEANRAFITVQSTSPDHGVKLDNFHVHYNDQNKELLILSEKANNDVSVELFAPVKSDLYITTQGKGNVLIQKMESDICRVQTEWGNCVLHSIKSHQVLVQSQGGNITGKGTIHGNVEFCTSGNSTVEMKKIQGTTMNVSTEHGPVKVKAIYAESTSIESYSGNIQLGHVHGDAIVWNNTGDIIVDGSNNGSLKVSSNSGNIDAYVGESCSAQLHSQQGAVSVRVPSSIRAGVQLCGASVEVSQEIVLQQSERDSKDNMTIVTGYMNGQPQGGQWIRAQADRGSISLKTQSWFESLKLGS